MTDYTIIQRPLNGSTWTERNNVVYQDMQTALRIVNSLNDMQANGYMYAVMELSE